MIISFISMFYCLKIDILMNCLYMFHLTDANTSYDVLPGTMTHKFLSMTTKRNNCPFCQEAFESSKELYEHRKSLRHRKNHLAALYYNSRYVVSSKIIMLDENFCFTLKYIISTPGGHWSLVTIT